MTQASIGTIRRVSSAKGMKWLGETKPREGLPSSAENQRGAGRKLCSVYLLDIFGAESTREICTNSRRMTVER